jgi:hypothetical protein
MLPAKSQFLRPTATTRSWFSARECRLPDYAAWVDLRHWIEGILTRAIRTDAA